MAEKLSLEKFGYSVRHVYDGEEAVRAVLDGTMPIDLILMDIDLGAGIDGTQAAERILERKDIPVVFLSSHSEPEILEKTEKITGYGYIVKNSSVTIVDASIKMAFRLFDAKNKAMKELAERIRSENALKESESTFQKLFEDSSDAILLIDAKGVFVECNQAALDLLGITREQFLYLPPDRISPPFQPDGRDSKEKAAEMIESAYRNGLHRFDWTCVNAAGSEFIVEVSLMPISLRGEVFLHTTWRDITVRKQVEERLARQNAYIRMILDNFPIGIATNEIDSLKVTYSNRKFNEIYGWPAEDFPTVGDFFVKVFPDEGYRREMQARIMEDISSGVPERMNWDNLSIVTKAGEERIVHAYNIPFMDQNIMVSTVQDITLRARAESQLKTQLFEKTILLKEIHHRIKNSVSSIEGLLTLQAQSAASREAASALQDAAARVHSIRALYDKLLVADDGQEIAIKGYVRDIVDSLLAVYDQGKRIVVDLSIQDFVVDSKIALSIGIITNELMTNIFKYAFESREAGKASVAIEKTGKRVLLTVKDDGVGMDEDALHGRSLGLGLSIVRMLAEQLRGTCVFAEENGTKASVEFEA
jgi:PAS domain S-box-containing protein